MSKILSMNPNAQEMNELNGMNAQEKAQMMEYTRLIKTAEYVKCSHCENLNFMQVHRIKKISGLMDGTGQDKIIPLTVFVCTDCGELSPESAKALEKFDN